MLRIAIKNGAILAAIQIGLLLGLYFLGVHPYAESTHAWNILVQILSIGVMIVYIRFALLEYKTFRSGRLQLGQALGVGILTTIAGSILTALFFLLFYYIIDPDTAAKINQELYNVLDQSQVPKEDIENLKSILEIGTNPIIMIVSDIFTKVFIGAIISLILGAILRTD